MLEQNNNGELPFIHVTQRKNIGDFETETTDLCVKGYTVKECWDTLKVVKKAFNI